MKLSLNLRQIKKFGVELLIAVVTFALTYVAENIAQVEMDESVRTGVVLGVHVALQYVRRIGRDTVAGGPPSA